MMNELTIIDRGGVEVVDSREVAEAIGKNHKELLRDIRNYAGILEKSTQRNFALSDFFISSTYTDSTGRTLPCYLLTKKGCDMVANKMTGERGVIFTAMYVSAFEKMRERITKPMTMPEMILAQAQLMVEHEKRLSEVESKVGQVARLSGALEKFASSSPVGDWQREMNARVSALCQQYGLNHESTRHQLYEEVEAIAHADLKRRLDNRQKRMEKQGIPKTRINSLSRMAIVAEDPKLRPIYEAQFNKLVAFYFAKQSGETQ